MGKIKQMLKEENIRYKQGNLRQIDMNVTCEHRVGLRPPVHMEEAKDEKSVLVALTQLCDFNVIVIAMEL